jgi:hypothetical protein
MWSRSARLKCSLNFRQLRVRVGLILGSMRNPFWGEIKSMYRIHVIRWNHDDVPGEEPGSIGIEKMQFYNADFDLTIILRAKQFITPFRHLHQVHLSVFPLRPVAGGPLSGAIKREEDG